MTAANNTLKPDEMPDEEICKIISSAASSAVCHFGKWEGVDILNALRNAGLIIAADKPADDEVREIEKWEGLERDGMIGFEIRAREALFKKVHNGFVEDKPLTLTNDEMAVMRRMYEATIAPKQDDISEKLAGELCGDAVNGGFIRTLCYTVWSICHHPTHADGNADWFNDTLPTVQKGVEQIREMLTAAYEKQKAIA